MRDRQQVTVCVVLASSGILAALAAVLLGALA